MIPVLSIMRTEMERISVPYEFMRWTSPLEYPYFVGEYTEVPTRSEDGSKEASLIITGTTRGTWLELEQMKEKIEGHFPSVHGLRRHTAKGTVAIFYENSFPMPTGESDLKRIQINLSVKEWRMIE